MSVIDDRTRFVFVLMYVSLEVLVFNLFNKQIGLQFTRPGNSISLKMLAI